MTLVFGLSEQALQERRSGIGGSDAYTVVHGTAEERYQLWREKIGEAKPKKIMGDWDRALRHVTETLQLDWYEHLNPGRQITRRGEVAVSPKYKWMRCTLDGFVEHLGVPINCKHVSRWTKEAKEWAIEHYTCQITHEAIVCGAPYGYISLLQGEKEPELLKIEVDPWYEGDLIEREEAFWKCCVERVPPGDCAHLDTPKVAEPVKRLRTLDLSAEMGSPEWQQLVAQNNWVPEAATLITDFIATEGPAKRHAIVRERFKAVMPDDCGEIRRGTFLATRTKNGAVTMRTEKTDA